MRLLMLPDVAGGAGEAAAQVVREGSASGRLRLEVPGLRGDRAAGRRIERLIGAWPGVRSVCADWRSGRILIVPAGPLGGAALRERIVAVPDRPLAASSAPAVLARLWRRFRSAAAGGAADLEAAWHALPVEEALARLGSGAEGLSAAEAEARLRAYGANATARTGPRARLVVLAGQVANLPTSLLLGSSGLSLLLGDVVDAAAILAVVGLNAAIGYRVERKNEELLASWQAMEAGEAQVLRGGAATRVPATQVVPGDVLLLSAGDIVPADARVIEAHRLACDEALLTGESEAQDKERQAIAEAAPLAERASMLWAGTLVVGGHGRAVVTATGAARELARVERLVEEKRAPRAPLARRLDRLGNRTSLLALGAAGATAVAGLLHGRPLAGVVRGAVALGVAAIPEGLPLVSTAALVRSMQRMRREGMVVRRLTSAETLGGVTTICADKTGTLTLNRMRLEVLDLGEGPVDFTSVRRAAAGASPRELADAVRADPVALALATGLLNSDVEVTRRGGALEVLGSSTEQALVRAAHDAGLDGGALRRAFPRHRLEERREGTRYVVSVHGAPEDGGPAFAFVKGAPEQVLDLCERDLRGPLDPEGRARLLSRNEAMAADGLRVLALGWKRLDRVDRNVHGGYTLVGLAGLRDPLRPGAADTVAAAARAGIRTLILTGDQRRTGESIARAVGLPGEAIDGAEASRLLARMDGPLAARLRRLAVLARVAPADKVGIVEALRRCGEVVAMVGDGINDAPALKAADVGVAVGVRSSDLARQVADVVMSNEDLRSILGAVGEGRIVQDNLRRAIRYLFATNLSELALVLGATLVGLPEPLGPLQLLWINLLTDSLPALALALEPGHPEVLDRPPVAPEAPLIPVEWRWPMARDGLLLAGGGALGLAAGGPAVGFSLLTGLQLGYTLLCRAPGSAASPRFLHWVGAAAALQVPALGFAPLRALLGLRGAAFAPSLATFGAGLLVPALVRQLGGGEVLEWRREAVAPRSAAAEPGPPPPPPASRRFPATETDRRTSPARGAR